MTLGNDNGTDGQTDRRTDRVRRNMRPPPREEGRIIKELNLPQSRDGEINLHGRSSAAYMAENFNVMNTVNFEPGELSIKGEDDGKESAYEIRYLNETHYYEKSIAKIWLCIVSIGYLN